jgi:cell division protein FtsW
MAKRLASDRVQLGLTLALLALGLVVLWSASTPFMGPSAAGDARGVSGVSIVLRQLFFATVGVAAMMAALRLNYRVLARPAVTYGVMAAAIALLLLALLSPSVNDTHRWIRFGGLSLQPSEWAKLAVVIFLAAEFERRGDRIQTVRDLFWPIVLVGLVLGLIYLQPDFGSAAHVALVAAVLAFVAGVPKRLFLLGGTIAAPLLWFGIMGASYRIERIVAFLDPWGQRTGSGYQLIQGMIAVGSGGITGKGFMKGDQKLSYLPYPFSDFIFGVVGEEFGFIGSVLVVLLFLGFLWRGLRTAYRAPDLFGRLLATGLTLIVVTQAFINISVVLGQLPTKGIPLPLFSAGGTSLVLCLLCVGLTLSISQHAD